MVEAKDRERVLAAARRAGLPVDPAWLDAVADNLRVLLDHAGRFMRSGGEAASGEKGCGERGCGENAR